MAELELESGGVFSVHTVCPLPLKVDRQVIAECFFVWKDLGVMVLSLAEISPYLCTFELCVSLP